MSRTFTINGVEHGIHKPRGMHGVRAVNYVMRKLQVSKQGEDMMGAVGEMFDDDEFWGKHLANLLGVKKDELEGIDYSELLSAVLTSVAEIMDGFKVPEVDAALKNSEDTKVEVEEKV